MNSSNDLRSLKRSRPEWSPWLAVVEEALAESAGTRWDAFVPAAPEAERARPLLSHSTIVIDESAVRGLLKDALERATQLLRARRATLDRCVHALMAKETLEESELLALVSSAAAPALAAVAPAM